MRPIGGRIGEICMTVFPDFVGTCIAAITALELAPLSSHPTYVFSMKPSAPSVWMTRFGRNRRLSIPLRPLLGMLRIDEFVGLHINEGVGAIARHAALRDLERVEFLTVIDLTGYR
jgi:hypothetical protein